MQDIMGWSDQKTQNYHNLQWVKETGLIGLLEAICGKGGNFLEVGCGTGAMIDRIAHHYVRSVGIDPIVSLLERAPKRDGIEYYPIPLEELEYRDEFDTVLMRNILHHVQDPESAVEHVFKTVKPGGKLVVCEGVPPSSRELKFYTELFRMFDNRHILNEGDLISMFRLGGFREICLYPYFMENVDLVDWLRKVSANEAVAKQAFELHKRQDDHFRRAYEVREGDGRYTMTWRFVVVAGMKP